MRKTLLYILIVAGLAGCVRETGWKLSSSGTGFVVVDGILTNEKKAHAVILTFSVGELDKKPLPVIGATVLISNEDSTWTLTEQPVNSGIYRTDSNFIARDDRSYTLQVYYLENIFTARTYMVPGEYFQELTYEKDPEGGLYHVKWNMPSFSTGSPAMWEILADWSMVPGYENSTPDSTHARLLFYTLPTLDVSQIFAPEVEKVSFPAGTVITETRYSLNPDHAAFIRELLMETEWTGGFFPTAAANVKSNISGGAYGYFGACAVTRLSLTVKEQ